MLVKLVIGGTKVVFSCFFFLKLVDVCIVYIPRLISSRRRQSIYCVRVSNALLFSWWVVFAISSYGGLFHKRGLRVQHVCLCVCACVTVQY